MRVALSVDRGARTRIPEIATGVNHESVQFITMGYTCC